MSFSAKFNVWIKWRDYRLGYHNLKDVYRKNVVLEYMVNDLWKPILVFANNNQQKIIEFGPSSCVMMIQRNGDSTEVGLSQLDEARVYNSSETDLWVVSSHYLDFKCQFDLTYFPFDNQKCYITVSMPFKLYKELYTWVQTYALTS